MIFACPLSVHSRLWATVSFSRSLFIAAFLALTLTVVGTIHVVEDASVSSAGGFGYFADHSQDQLEHGSNEAGESSCSSLGPKAMRNGIESQNGVDKICGLVVPLETFPLGPENREANVTLSSLEPAPEGDLLPHELLSRPPPA